MTDDAIFEALDTLIATFDTGKREPLVPKEPVSGGRDLHETTQAEKIRQFRHNLIQLPARG